MKKMETSVSFRSNRRKLHLCYLLFYYSVLTMFSHFQATYLLISPKVFGILTANLSTKVRKKWQNFWYQNQSGFEKFVGMMLWIMSGNFLVIKWCITCDNFSIVTHWKSVFLWKIPDFFWFVTCLLACIRPVTFLYCTCTNTWSRCCRLCAFHEALPSTAWDVRK